MSFISKYVTKGTVSSVLSLLAFGAAAFGKGGLSTFFADPQTAQAILGLVGSAGMLYAGAAQGVKAS